MCIYCHQWKTKVQVTALILTFIMTENFPIPLSMLYHIPADRMVCVCVYDRERERERDLNDNSWEKDQANRWAIPFLTWPRWIWVLVKTVFKTTLQLWPWCFKSQICIKVELTQTIFYLFIFVVAKNSKATCHSVMKQASLPEGTASLIIRLLSVKTSHGSMVPDVSHVFRLQIFQKR